MVITDLVSGNMYFTLVPSGPGDRVSILSAYLWAEFAGIYKNQYFSDITVIVASEHLAAQSLDTQLHTILRDFEIVTGNSDFRQFLEAYHIRIWPEGFTL